MDFSYNETQQQIKDLAAQVFADYTTQEKLRPLDNAGYYDANLWQQLADVGLLGTAIAEQHGGMGLDFETLCVLIEEAGRTVAPIPLLPVLVSAVSPLQQFASAELAAQILPPIASGESQITTALHEPAASKVASPKTTATENDGAWLMTGKKICVPAAFSASQCWTMAVIKNGVNDKELGVFLFVLNDDSINRSKQVMTNGEYEADLVLSHTPAQLIVRGGEATEFLSMALNVSRAANAAWATGLCEKMNQLSASYTTEREQFGQPIAKFQAVAHKLADAYINTDCLKAVKEQAVTRINEKAQQKDITDAALTTQFWTGEALHRVSHAAQQVHGGAGIDRDYPLFRYCLAAKKAELSFGGSRQALSNIGALIAIAP